MQKEIKFISEERQIIRITCIDERWYAKPGKDTGTGLPEFTFYPSSTWIAGSYPKGISFYKWLADQGWERAEALKIAGGTRGSIVHQALEIIEKARELPISTIFTDPNGHARSMTAEEMDSVVSFAKWHDKTLPELLATELTVFNEEYTYAGTLDRIYRISGQIYIVDFKTSQQIWEEMKLQVSSYSHADFSENALYCMGIKQEEWAKRKMAILQVGYRLNKHGYKFTEIEDKFDLFLMAKSIWKNEHPDSRPKQRDYPLTIKLKEKESNAQHLEAVQVPQA